MKILIVKIRVICSANKKFEKLTVLNKKDFNESYGNLKSFKEPLKIAYNIASNLNLQIFEKQELLEIGDARSKLEKLNTYIEKETSLISVEKKIRGRVKNQMEKTQREYYLNEQLKAIQKELGEIDDGEDLNTNISRAINKANAKKCAREMFF